MFKPNEMAIQEAVEVPLLLVTFAMTTKIHMQAEGSLPASNLEDCLPRLCRRFRSSSDLGRDLISLFGKIWIYEKLQLR